MTRHTPPPWSDALTPRLPAGDDRVLGGGRPFGVGIRILSEENFQFARHRVNAHDDLVAALEAALPGLERFAVEEARANLAPTGLPKRTGAKERLEQARAALAKARGEQSRREPYLVEVAPLHPMTVERPESVWGIWREEAQPVRGSGWVELSGERLECPEEQARNIALMMNDITDIEGVRYEAREIRP